MNMNQFCCTRLEELNKDALVKASPAQKELEVLKQNVHVWKDCQFWCTSLVIGYALLIWLNLYALKKFPEVMITFPFYHP
jgi:hypothetical protein